MDNGYLLTKTVTALLFYFLFKQENMTMIGVMFVSANFQYFDGGRLALAQTPRSFSDLILAYVGVSQDLDSYFITRLFKLQIVYFS